MKFGRKKEKKKYTSFAHVYDTFMDNVEYETWRDFIVKKLHENGVKNGIVCDLGCGTGNITEMLADEGYDMIGIDASADMLSIAKQRGFMRSAKRGEAATPDILYLQQDMRSFELYGTVRAIVSICDSINYITKEDELKTVFKLVNNYLDPKGVFLFDINTPAKYEKIGENTIAENREEGSFIWENSYDKNKRLNEYSLTLFLQEQDGRFRRSEELHLQRAWTKEEIEKALEEAGLEFVECCEAYSGEKTNEKTERLCFIAREKGK